MDPIDLVDSNRSIWFIQYDFINLNYSIDSIWLIDWYDRSDLFGMIWSICLIHLVLSIQLIDSIDLIDIIDSLNSSIRSITHNPEAIIGSQRVVEADLPVALRARIWNEGLEQAIVHRRHFAWERHFPSLVKLHGIMISDQPTAAGDLEAGHLRRLVIDRRIDERLFELADEQVDDPVDQHLIDWWRN